MTDRVTLHHGDCLDVLRELPDNSVHAVVTDPPYGLEFMGKEWDAFKPSSSRIRQPSARDAKEGAAHNASTFLAARNTPESYVAGTPFQAWCEQWATECLRVLTPGGHLLAFGGTRTWHRLACAIEDAGFEVRDSISWIYGSGFPKSLNVGKDARFCQCGKVESNGAESSPEHLVSGVHVADVPQAGRAGAGAGSVLLQGVQEQGASIVGEVPPAREQRSGQPVMEGRGHAEAPEGELHRSALREVPPGVPADGTGGRLHHGAPSGHGSMGGPDADALGVRGPSGPRPVEQCAGEPGAVPDERGSQAGRGRPLCARCGKQSAVGLGTALKPAHEPIVVARKPLGGTVAATVLAHGTGALNVDGCRVGTTENLGRPTGSGAFGIINDDGWVPTLERTAGSPLGRWPANVLLDQSQAAALDAESGVLAPGNQPRVRNPDERRTAYGDFDGQADLEHRRMDGGGASRFFPTFHWQAKAPTDERPSAAGVRHPTVKPLDLMRWLVRLVTPPGGTVLEPFAGSGTTVEACLLEGFRCIAIEREASYLPLIRERINRQTDPVAYHRDEAADDSEHDPGLFGLLDESA